MQNDDESLVEYLSWTRLMTRVVVVTSATMTSLMTSATMTSLTVNYKSNCCLIVYTFVGPRLATLAL